MDASFIPLHAICNKMAWLTGAQSDSQVCSFPVPLITLCFGIRLATINYTRIHYPSFLYLLWTFLCLIASHNL